jgi:hypothetical protein
MVIIVVCVFFFLLRVVNVLYWVKVVMFDEVWFCSSSIVLVIGNGVIVVLMC